jgi:carbamoyl-phosphate synthase large subunit
VPYVSKSIGVPLAKMAARVMTGRTLRELGFTEEVALDYYCVKEAVMPFIKFPGADSILGPEMKSTGEVMGIDRDYGVAFAKSQMSVNSGLPVSGRIFISVNREDKEAILPIAAKLRGAGLTIVATAGTRDYLEANGIPTELVLKIHEGRPHVIDLLTDGSVGLMINTPIGRDSHKDDYELRRAAIIHNVPYTTTIAGAAAAVEGILALQKKPLTVKCLQEYHS